MRIQLELCEGDLLDGELDPALVGMNAAPFVPREAVEAQDRGKDQDREERSMSSHEGPSMLEQLRQRVAQNLSTIAARCNAMRCFLPAREELDGTPGA